MFTPSSRHDSLISGINGVNRRTIDQNLYDGGYDGAVADDLLSLTVSPTSGEIILTPAAVPAY